PYILINEIRIQSSITFNRARSQGDSILNQYLHYKIIQEA
ncbi:unnamed protein product, partial [marine sediment metagenome]